MGRKSKAKFSPVRPPDSKSGNLIGSYDDLKKLNQDMIPFLHLSESLTESIKDFDSHSLLYNKATQKAIRCGYDDDELRTKLLKLKEISVKCMEDDNELILRINEHIGELNIIKYGIDPENKVINFLENTDEID